MRSFADGALTVARLEFVLRIRAGRWRWMLASWFVLLALVAGATREGILRSLLATRLTQYRGAAMFGVLMIVLLGLSLLVCPALAGQSVNGDRERGTLATLQVTRLGAAEIAVGKLLASWCTALVFLGVTLPLTGWCLAEGGLSLLRVAGVYLVMALLLGVTCAMSLALSALFARTTTSSVLAYLLVFAGTGGSALAFVLATAVTEEQRTIHVRSCQVLTDQRGNLVDEDGNPTTEPVETDCHAQPITTPLQRPDRTWWLLAPNPFVVLADSAPAAPTVTERGPGGQTVTRVASLDPLGAMARELRGIRSAPEVTRSDVGDFYAQPADGPPVWPFGLAVDVLVGAGALVLTARRLRTPTRRLPRGQRVA